MAVVSSCGIFGIRGRIKRNRNNEDSIEMDSAQTDVYRGGDQHLGLCCVWTWKSSDGRVLA